MLFYDEDEDVKMRFEVETLNDKSLEELRVIFLNIPKSETRIGLIGSFTKTSRFKSSYIAEALSYLPKHVATVELGGNYAYSSSRYQEVTGKKWSSESKGMVSTYSYQDHSHRGMGDLLEKIVASLPKSVNALFLNFSRSDAHERRAHRRSSSVLYDLIYIFKNIPKNVTHIDLGNVDSSDCIEALNYWFRLFCNHSLAEAHYVTEMINSIPNTVTEISAANMRYYYRGLQNVETIRRGPYGNFGDGLSARLLATPSHVNTVDFRNSNLFDLSVFEFADALPSLPYTITTLDLGGNDLCNQSALELHYLFSKIPVNVMTLKLQRNNLSSLNEATLKQAFSALHNNMRDLDLSDNGFDRLFHTNLNQLLSAAPDILLRIGDRGSLSIRNDGALIPSLPAVFHGIFKPLRHVRHHQQFAELRLVMWQLIQSKNINLDLTGVIFSFLLPPSLRDISYMLDKLATRIIPSRPPASITKLEQQECMEAAHFRINSLNPHSTRLDLSRCGLNRLNAAMLRGLFQTIPVTATGISFRGNGFQHLEQGMQAFLEVIKEIPDHITYLDLSENGFEFDHDALSRTKQLLTNLPATVQYVSLAHEQPLSPAKHLARIAWSNRYLPLRLVTQTQTPMQQARILLDDYTQGDSAFFRVIKGRWNRPCADEIAKIVQCIDHDLITSTIDLSAELEQLPVQNYGESLSSRISFISQIATKTPLAQIDAFESDHDGLRAGLR